MRVRARSLAAVAALTTTLAVAPAVPAFAADPVGKIQQKGLVPYSTFLVKDLGGGAYWLSRSGGRGPVVLLGALHLFELLMLVLVFRTAEQAPPTALFVVFVVLSAAGTVAAGLTLAGRREALRG